MTEDDNSGFDLSRRKVLGGVLTVGAASAATGAGTMALFSDSEESQDNTIQAGTLDLTDGFASSSFAVGTGDTGLKPGDHGTKYFSLTNEGSIDGTLDFSINDVSASQTRSSEAEDEGVNTGEFDIKYGSTPAGPKQGMALNVADFGLQTQKTTASLSGGSGSGPYIEVETAGDIDNNSDANYVELALDLNNDGFSELLVKYAGGGSWSYKRATESNGFAISPTSGTPNELSVANYSNGTLTLEIKDSAAADDAIAIGGVSQYSGMGRLGGNQLYVPVVPSTVPGPFGQAAFNSDSGELMTIDGSQRHIDDVVQLSFTVDPDFGSDKNIRDGDETLVSDGYTLGSHEQVRLAEGRPSRISGVDFDTNANLDSSGSTYLVVEYLVPYNAGNAIQGEEVTFDIEATLTQDE